jgi:DNA-binding transcriptional regulator YiaG
MTPAEILQARQSLGLSRKQFAELLGLRNHQKVAKWEQGVYQISDEGATLIRMLLEQANKDG